MVTYSLVVVAALAALLALSVFRAAPGRSVNRHFALFSLSISTWIVGIAGIHGTRAAEFWGSVAFCGASLIAPALLSFVSSYPVHSPIPSPRLTIATLLAGGLFAALSLLTGYVVFDIRITPAGVAREAGPLYPFFVIYFASVVLIALGLLIFKWRRSKGAARVQLQYLTGAIFLGATGPLTTNLLVPFITGSSTYSWVGPFFILAWLALIAHAIIRYRLMDLKLVVHRGLTIAIASSLSLLPVALLLLVIWPTHSIDFTVTDRVLLLSAIVIATLLVPITRDFASQVLDRYVYRTQANYISTVTRASQMLTKVLDLHTLLRFIGGTVMKSTNVYGVVIYLRETGHFRLASLDEQQEQASLIKPETIPSQIVRVMAHTKRPIIADEIARDLSREPIANLHTCLDKNGWALLLPIQADSDLIGIIALGQKLSGDPFYPQDLDLLMTLANQAGIAVKNAQLYAQVVLANEHINNIVATIESGVVAIDATGSVTMFNREAERLTGLTATSLARQPVSKLPPTLGSLLLAGMAGDAQTVPEIEVSTASSSVTPLPTVICTTSPLRDPSGKVLGAVAVFNDLTPVKELEAARRQAERLAYFELLASGIAHEIKNPLVSIKTYSQLLPRRLDNERFIEEFGRIAEREISRIEHLLERLRRLSRPSGRPYEKTDLRQPLEDALESLKAAFEEKGIAVAASIQASPLFVLGDRCDLDSLCFNLLLNAHEAAPAHGNITVNLKHDVNTITLKITDNGPGISPELRERIFDPFFSTKARGTGLGLALCASIAQSHRATLRANNVDGGGAIFTVEFPAALPAEAQPAADHGKEHSAEHRARPQ